MHIILWRIMNSDVIMIIKNTFQLPYCWDYLLLYVRIDNPRLDYCSNN